MHQCQHPTEQQGDSQHNEEIARIDTCRVGRHENGQESYDGNQRGAQQRHGGLSSDGCHGFHPVFSGFQVHQYAVDDDNGIIHQHAHGQHKCSQRYALHGSSGELQEEE